MRVFDKLLETMTVETLADLGTKLINVNNRQLYYITSSGQMFDYEHYQEALNHEYRWLLQEIPQSETTDGGTLNNSEGD